MRVEDPVAHTTIGNLGAAPRVCVVGNAALDLSLRVAHLPAAGETSLAVETLYDLGGKGANQAVVAARSICEVKSALRLPCKAIQSPARVAATTLCGSG
jgi:hypothetical protein